MRAMVIAGVTAALLSGCGNEQNSKPVEVHPPQQAIAPVPTVPPAPSHHYALRDGDAYGYERMPSQQEQQRGQGATTLTMVKYAGQQNGTHQAYVHDKATDAVTVIECATPCEFLKVMVFVRANKPAVSVERMRAMPGILGSQIIEDAINGKLKQFISEKNGQSHTLWFDEKRGLIKTPYMTR